MKHLSIPPLEIPITEFASQGNALLGIKGSGKTYGATYLAERLMDAGIPIIAFDPIGVWRNLKVPGKGKAYPVVVAHPENGDLPLTPHSAPEIVRAAMRENVSLVIDLYSMKLSKADWRNIVEQCIRILLYENKTLRHLFIEEASEFCPQRVQPDQGRVYAEIEKLARMGGNASLGYTLINQRAEEVNKAVLEICDCLILHRQKGKNSLTSLGKWLDFSDADLSKKIVKSLPTLDPGQCWIWSQGEDIPTLCRFPEKNTYHPDRKHPAAKVAEKALDVGSFVAKMKGTLETVLAEAKENDPAELKKRIRELEQICRSRPPEVREVPVLTDEDRHIITDASLTVRDYAQNLMHNAEAIKKSFDALLGKLTAPSTLQPNPNRAYSKAPIGIDFSPPKTLRIKSPPQNGPLGKCERAILTALAQYPHGRSTNQIAVLTGYSIGSGGFNNSLSALTKPGYIVRGNPVLITGDGLKVLGEFDPLPTGRALLEYWMGKLPRCERALLEALTMGGRHEATPGELADATGYATSSGGFNNALSRLRVLELITRGQPIKAHDNLFQ